ncbi:MAG: hypothetical protein ACKOXK_07805 [Chakrabartia sp.]
MARSRFKSIMQIPLVRWTLFGLGVLFMACAPLVAPLPGPAGTVFFAIGLGLVLQTSAWARRRYVIFKRRYPKPGHWADWGLRRASYKRRLARKKQAKGN